MKDLEWLQGNYIYDKFLVIYIILASDKSVYMNNDWKIMDRDELVEDVYENKRAYVIENLDTFINQLDEPRKKSNKEYFLCACFACVNFVHTNEMSSAR
jgi:hypothetical protein